MLCYFVKHLVRGRALKKCGEKHLTTSSVSPDTSFVFYRFLYALQQNRAQSRILYLLTIVFCWLWGLPLTLSSLINSSAGAIKSWPLRCTSFSWNKNEKSYYSCLHTRGVLQVIFSIFATSFWQTATIKERSLYSFFFYNLLYFNRSLSNYLLFPSLILLNYLFLFKECHKISFGDVIQIKSLYSTEKRLLCFIHMSNLENAARKVSRVFRWVPCVFWFNRLNTKQKDNAMRFLIFVLSVAFTSQSQEHRFG